MIVCIAFHGIYGVDVCHKCPSPDSVINLYFAIQFYSYEIKISYCPGCVYVDSTLDVFPRDINARLYEKRHGAGQVFGGR